MLNFHKKPSRFKTKLIFISVILIITYAFVITLSHYFSVTNSLMEEIEDNNIYSLNLVLDSVTDILSEHEENNLSKTIYSNSLKITETHFTQDPILYQDYKNLFLDIDENIDTTFLFMPQYDYLVGIFPWYSSYTFRYANSDDFSKISDKLSNSSAEEIFLVNFYEDKYYLMSVLTMRDSSFNVLGYFYSGTDVSGLVSDLSAISSDSINSVAIYNDNQVLLSTEYDSELEKAVISTEFSTVEQLKQNENLATYILHDDEFNLTIASYGEYLGGQAIPDIFSGYPYLTIGLGSLLIAGFCFLTLFIISKPINKLTSMASNQNLIPQNINEFQVIENYISELSVKNLNYQNSVDKTGRLLREKILLLVLSGKELSQAEDFEVSFKYEFFIPCVIAVNQINNSYFSSADDLIKFIQSNFIENIDYTNFSSELMNIENSEIFILFNVDEKNQEFLICLENSSKEMQTCINDKFGDDINFKTCVGETVTSLEKVYPSYLKAKHIVSFPGEYTDLNQVTEINNKERKPLAHFRKKLLNEIVENNSKNIDDLLNEVHLFLIAEKFNINQEEVLNFFIRCITETIVVISLSNKEIYNISSETLNIMSFVETTGLEEKIELMKKFYSAVLTISKTDNAKLSEDRISKACEFISQNYNKDISLDSVAEYLGLHPVYFSGYFKKVMKVGFNEYLNSVRIKATEKLLSDLRIPLNSVANEAGYLNYQTFSRAFKKINLVTPKQFRENLASEQSSIEQPAS